MKSTSPLNRLLVASLNSISTIDILEVNSFVLEATVAGSIFAKQSFLGRSLGPNGIVVLLRCRRSALNIVPLLGSLALLDMISASDLSWSGMEASLGHCSAIGTTRAIGGHLGFRVAVPLLPWRYWLSVTESLVSSAL